MIVIYLRDNNYNMIDRANPKCFICPPYTSSYTKIITNLFKLYFAKVSPEKFIDDLEKII